MTSWKLIPLSPSSMQHCRPLLPLLICLSCLPYTVVYFVNLWEFAHYQFFPVLIAAIVVLLWQRTGEYTRGSLLTQGVSWALVLGAVFASLCATAFASPWMGYCGFAAGVSAWLACRRDSATAKGTLLYFALPIGLLWQPPYNTIVTADTVLIQKLQMISAKLSSRWLDALGYIHFQPGTVLEFAGKRFGVAEACSGIQSFFAVVCFAALISVYLRRNWLHTAALMATSPLWAILMNTIRITVIPIAYSAFGIDLSHGLIHDLLGFCTMGLAIVLLFSADELLLKLSELLPVIPTFSSAPATDSQGLGPRRLAFLSVPALIAVAFCGLQVNDAVQSWGSQRKTIDFFRDEPLLQLSYRDAPSTLQGWPQLDYRRESRERDNDDLGQQSDLWYYGSPYGRVTLSFDQMFPGWHELPRCYRSAGWTMDNRQVLSRNISGDWPIVSADFSRSGEYGYLVWTLKTRDGKPVQPPGEWNTWTSLKERLQNRLTPSVRGALFGIAVYQMQVFVSEVEPISEAAKKDAIEALLQARPELWEAAEREIQREFGT